MAEQRFRKARVGGSIPLTGFFINVKEDHMAGSVVEFSDINFDAEVLQAKTPVLVDLWAAWCGPCRMIAPMIEELAGKYQGKMKMVKLNIDDYPQLAGQFRVMNIPTLLFFEGGKEVDRIVGVVPKEELARRIDTVISS